MQELKDALKTACKKLFNINIEPELTRPDEKFGDYSSNAALQLAKQLGKNPSEVAKALADELSGQALLEEVSVAGPGFLNLKLTDETLGRAALAAAELAQPLKDKEILVEFGDANPFKEMHIGHLYSLIAGNAISSLLEVSGAEVKRLSYHGDVGLHVAKAIWGMQKTGVKPETSNDNLGIYYAQGAKAYEEDEQAKAEIQQINEHIYKKDDAAINKLYDWGRTKSFDQFDEIYAELGIKYDKNYFESESSPEGLKFVQEHKQVFKESQGALVYEGKKAGLHTRVFITSKGLPTYETKDLGLAELKNQDYPKAARSVIVTANEQSEYFKVMLAALKEIDSELAKKTTHLPHGFVNLTTGKMSSRTGNVYKAEDLLQSVKEAVAELYPGSKLTDEIALGATKYAFLKHRLGQNISVDTKEAASLEGNSGPYLQYAHARAKSILAKAQGSAAINLDSLEPGERLLARKISEYPEVAATATQELMPHHICTYLYDLAQTFNRFYENNRVLDDPRQDVRLKLVEVYASVLKHGLGLLNITAPDKM